MLNKCTDKFPVVTRDCVKVIILLIYSLQHHKLDEEQREMILVTLTKMFNNTEYYLKNCIMIALLEISDNNNEAGIICINCLIKDIDSKGFSKRPHLKNLGLRCLYSNLPQKMFYDFEKYIKQATLAPTGYDNAVILASEYLKNYDVVKKVNYDISDYHQSLINSLPINKYSGLLELKKIAKYESNLERLSSYLELDTDDQLFLEACKVLTMVRPEKVSRFVDVAVRSLKVFLRSSEIKQFAAIRILSKLSFTFPLKVSRANREIEDLIHSSNRSLGVLSIITLIRTGNQESVKKLSYKLEPYMESMPMEYSILALDTMEKLAKTEFKDFIRFLKKMMADTKNSMIFKKYILSKFKSLMKKIDQKQKIDIINYLCSYIEDPDYYQLTMDILGIIGSSLENKKELIHVYNRLILDNDHVKNCAIQTLYDLDIKFNTLETVDNFRFSNSSFVSFLKRNKNLKRGEFDMNELGEYKEDVMNYLNKEEESDEEDDYVPLKICREIDLTDKKSDFIITLIKKIFPDKCVLEFTVQSNFDKVVLQGGRITLEGNKDKYSVDVDSDGVYEIEVPFGTKGLYNGVFEYFIGLKDDTEDVENDLINLEPFTLTVLDFTKPEENLEKIQNSIKIKKQLKCNYDEVISQVVKVSNLYLEADSNNFSLSGQYNQLPILIEGKVYQKGRVSDMNMEIFCDDKNILKEIVEIFE
ncbi:COPG1 [Hepatospora eriocheir]|uniref:COPG1 n=1 Tax=Hepatospora eriocheir TaxID=1081669 RepID=A0A1X0QLA1_9MICR|nr:COPG1 [Hepatospora eriocheir]